jgi:tRNA (cmo5U34)-methyltransferase
MGQFHFDPATYLPLIRADVPAYDELQRRIADAASGVGAERILDLGAGTGETSRALRAVYPQAPIVAVDVSEAMLARLDVPGVERHVARLQDPLPEGGFDLVVSALAVHHLDPGEKRDLFARIHAALRPGGRFVLGDVVIADAVVAPLTDGYDKPDRTLDQLGWLVETGFAAQLLWERDDLAVIRADLRA